jgi:hypothetical protein
MQHDGRYERYTKDFFGKPKSKRPYVKSHADVRITSKQALKK